MEIIKPKMPLFDLSGFRDELKQVLQDIQTDGTRFMADYPEQILTKRGYVRTGTLKRSWMQAKPVLDRGTEMEAEIGSNANMAPYNLYVEGTSETQVPMFRNAGWQNVDDLIGFCEKRLPEDIQNVVKEAAE